MNTTIIAIDPGAKGAIAVLHDGTVNAHKMPETPHDLCSIIDAAHSDAVLSGNIIRAYIEQVSGFIGVGQPGSSAFSFGQGYGEIIGVLAHAKVPFVNVTPQRWQKALALGHSDRMRSDRAMTEPEIAAMKSHNARAKREWKNKLKAKAQQLYPTLKVTLETADALLILEYGRLLELTPAPVQPQMTFA